MNYIRKRIAPDNTLHTVDTGDSLPPLPETHMKFKIPSFESFAGYLWKKSSKFDKKWQKRWFIFINGHLQYFKDAEAANVLGLDYKNRKEYVGDMRQCKVSKVLVKNHKYTIRITTPLKREYFLKAMGVKDYNRWFSILSLSQSHGAFEMNDDDEKSFSDRYSEGIKQ